MAPNPNTSARVAARMPALCEDAGADDAADEVDPAEHQGGDSSETPEPPVRARTMFGTKNFQSAPSLFPGRSTSMPLPLEDEGDEAEEPPPSPPKKMDSYSLMIKLQRTKSDSQLAAESAMARIMALKAGIKEMDDRANRTLNSCQSIMDACGDAIAAWFKGLSGAALLRAIKEVRVRGRACGFACVWGASARSSIGRQGARARPLHTCRRARAPARSLGYFSLAIRHRRSELASGFLSSERASEKAADVHLVHPGAASGRGRTGTSWAHDLAADSCR